MIRKFALTSMLIMGSLLTFTNTANADYVQDEINRTNQMIRETEGFLNNVGKPQEQAYQRYLDDLYRACMNGNINACNEHRIRIREQNRRLDQEIQRVRNRGRY